jgi:hypothetical protein
MLYSSLLLFNFLIKWRRPIILLLSLWCQRGIVLQFTSVMTNPQAVTNCFKNRLTCLEVLPALHNIIKFCDIVTILFYYCISDIQMLDREIEQTLLRRSSCSSREWKPSSGPESGGGKLVIIWKKILHITFNCSTNILL